ncbi:MULTISPECIES: autotransporter domain-containing protein [Desulfosediminicola]|uniref:autotransporter domain-containing protein n=1 Tax=Desulfosediminicola TaxID=2886823 RepID=UPI0010AB6A79|nr:autotransporter domain-containing protein [Desulfosediminicola ganghwensis]
MKARLEQEKRRKILSSIIFNVVFTVGAIHSIGTVGFAAPITYEGDLGTSEDFFGQVVAGNNYSNPTGWSYYAFGAKAGTVITINGHRQENALDPVAGVFSGIFTDTAELPGSSIGSGITSADDNMAELPGFSGPWADPSISFVVPDDGLYTYAISSFVSGDPGIDGVYDYMIVAYHVDNSVESMIMARAAAVSTDALLHNQGKEENVLISQYIHNQYDFSQGFLQDSGHRGITLWAVPVYRNLDLGEGKTFLGDADGTRNGLYVGMDILRRKDVLCGIAFKAHLEEIQFDLFETEVQTSSVGAALYGAYTLPYGVIFHGSASYGYIQNDLQYQLWDQKPEDEYNSQRWLAAAGLSKMFQVESYRFLIGGNYIFGYESSEKFSTTDGIQVKTDSAQVDILDLNLDVTKQVLANLDVYGSLHFQTDLNRSLADKDSGVDFYLGFITELDPGISFDLRTVIGTGDIDEYGIQGTLSIQL